MPYQVPQDIDSNKIFLVRFSELDERLDAQFYRKHFDFQSYEKLSSVAKVNGGKRIPLGKDYSIEPTAFLYLRVTDIQDDGFVDFSKLRYIDEETYQVLKQELLERLLLSKIFQKTLMLY